MSVSILNRVSIEILEGVVKRPNNVCLYIGDGRITGFVERNGKYHTEEDQ